MQQIADWLKQLGMDEHSQRFAENDIDFAILSDITDQDLEKIGVTSLGHRRKLLRAIADLGTFGRRLVSQATGSPSAGASSSPGLARRSVKAAKRCRAGSVRVSLFIARAEMGVDARLRPFGRSSGALLAFG